MTIERNKGDFEKALSTMEDRLGDLSGIIHEDIQSDLNNVVDEYAHLQSDIEEMMSRIEELEEKLERAES